MAFTGFARQGLANPIPIPRNLDLLTGFTGLANPVFISVYSGFFTLEASFSGLTNAVSISDFDTTGLSRHITTYAIIISDAISSYFEAARFSGITHTIIISKSISNDFRRGNTRLSGITNIVLIPKTIPNNFIQRTG
jgi:hypothetical protein